MSRKPLIAGNWKMNLNHFEAIALVQKIAFSLPDKYFDKVDVAVLPPFTDLRSVQTLVDGDKLRLTYGAQDVSQHDAGAYTGDISGAFLAKLGCTFVVVGHSERRTYHHEDDALVAAKSAAAFKHGLTPIICIGEQLEVREAGNHVEHNVEMLRGSLAGLSADQIGNSVIAYEPVWAIGTGRVASAADAQEVCKAIRDELGKLASPQLAAGIRVLYGGSVNTQNGREIVAHGEVDGALLGRASPAAGCFRAAGSTPRAWVGSSRGKMVTAHSSAARRWTPSSSPRCLLSPPAGPCPETSSQACSLAAMELALQITLIVTSVLVVLLVLLHRAKGGGLSTLFGGGVQSSLSGSTVVEKNLDRLTLFVTGIWLVSIIGVALMIKYT